MNCVVANGAAHGEVAGKLYRITSFLPHAELGLIPVLVSIFYDKLMRLWFERRVEAYLSQENQAW